MLPSEVQVLLGRTDQIDGGSAQDTINVSMDGNFLLGFSSGLCKMLKS